MSQQLSTLRTSLLNRKKDLSDVSDAIFLEWCNFIADFVYDNVKSTDPERYTQEQSFSVSSSPSNHDLPADFNDETEWGNGFYEVDSDGLDQSSRLVRTGFGRRDRGYWITGDQVQFTGVKDPAQFRLRYMPIRVIYTSTSDFFTIDGLTTGAVLIPDGKTRYAVAALDVLYTIWDEVPSDEAFADVRFVRQLDLLLNKFRKEPAAYGMTDYSSMY